MEYHLLDDEHLEVLAGEIPKGIWKLVNGSIVRDGDESVRINQNIKKWNVRLKQKVSTLDTMNDLPIGRLLGVGLAIAIGPWGGLAGSAVGLVAGKHKFYCVGCELNDGRKVILRMRSTVLEKIKKLSVPVLEGKKKG